MFKHLKYLGILSLLCFSFFYTEKIAEFMHQKDPLYVSIETLKDDCYFEERTLEEGIANQHNLKVPSARPTERGASVHDFISDMSLLEYGKKYHLLPRRKYLYLTESGLATAEKIYERHLFLSEWLEKLGVNPVVAASDACKIEHVISSESFAAIKKHIDLDSMK